MASIICMPIPYRVSQKKFLINFFWLSPHVPLLRSTSDFARWQQQERDTSRQPREILKVTFFGTPCTSVRNNSSFEDGVDHQFCDSVCNYQSPESFPSSICNSYFEDGVSHPVFCLRDFIAPIFCQKIPNQFNRNLVAQTNIKDTKTKTMSESLHHT